MSIDEKKEKKGINAKLDAICDAVQAILDHVAAPQRGRGPAAKDGKKTEVKKASAATRASVRASLSAVRLFASTRRRFSTDDVSDHFAISRGSAAAFVAILRRDDTLVHDGRVGEKSFWRFAG